MFEYAFRLPETCKKIQICYTVLQFAKWTYGSTIVLMTLCGVTAIIALGFHTLLLSIVAALPERSMGVSNSRVYRIRINYGLVISALLFLLLLAGLRYILPWQRISGFIESLSQKKVETPPSQEDV